MDPERFRLPGAEERVQARHRFGVPREAFCVGSFQKDGVGWGDGFEPKLIKGPDILLAALQKVPRRDLFVLVSGPARGYVLRGLEKAGVRFACLGFKRSWEMPALYHALDAYVISSREEGGPAALLEAMGCGVRSHRRARDPRGVAR
jgi:glycosyltransferase involved in cell wall biosynthesis